jgi:hypothetical protein
MKGMTLSIHPLLAAIAAFVVLTQNPFAAALAVAGAGMLFLILFDYGHAVETLKPQAPAIAFPSGGEAPDRLS